MKPPAAERLEEFVAQGRLERAAALLERLDPSEAANAVMAIPYSQQQTLFRGLPVELAAALAGHFQHREPHRIPDARRRAHLGCAPPLPDRRRPRATPQAAASGPIKHEGPVRHAPIRAHLGIVPSFPAEIRSPGRITPQML